MRKHLLHPFLRCTITFNELYLDRLLLILRVHLCIRRRYPHKLMSHLPKSEPSVQNGDAPGPTHSAGSRSEHASPSLSSADRAASELDVEVGTGVGAVPVSHDQPATALSLATHPDVGPPPDGGLEAWLCMIGGMLQMFCVFGFSEWKTWVN